MLDILSQLHVPFLTVGGIGAAASHGGALPGLDKIGSILLMLLFISVLIIAHEYGHFWVARKCGIRVQRFGFGLPFGPTLWSKKIGEVEYCVHAALFGGYVAFPDDDPDNPLPKDSPERFENQPVASRFAVMIAGVTVNAIVGWLLMFTVVMIWGYPTGNFENRVFIGNVLSDTAPAAKAGFQKGDELSLIDGKPLPGAKLEDKLAAVPKAMQQYAGKTITVTVLRHNKPTPLTVTPDKDGHIGIKMAYKLVYAKAKDPIDAASRTSAFLGDTIAKQFEAFGRLFTGKMSLKELSGPIGIVGQGSDMILEHGIQTGLMLTAIISVILAVMNLLPIPALDGGHIFFLLIEMIKGSPVKQEIREQITQVGFFGLLGLIAFILLNDINNTFINPPH